MQCTVAFFWQYQNLIVVSGFLRSFSLKKKNKRIYGPVKGGLWFAHPCIKSYSLLMSTSQINVKKHSLCLLNLHILICIPSHINGGWSVSILILCNSEVQHGVHTQMLNCSKVCFNWPKKSAPFLAVPLYNVSRLLTLYNVLYPALQV